MVDVCDPRCSEHVVLNTSSGLQREVLLWSFFSFFPPDGVGGRRAFGLPPHTAVFGSSSLLWVRGEVVVCVCDGVSAVQT